MKPGSMWCNLYTKELIAARVFTTEKLIFIVIYITKKKSREVVFFLISNKSMPSKTATFVFVFCVYMLLTCVSVICCVLSFSNNEQNTHLTGKVIELIDKNNWPETYDILLNQTTHDPENFEVYNTATAQLQNTFVWPRSSQVNIIQDQGKTNMCVLFAICWMLGSRNKSNKIHLMLSVQQIIDCKTGQTDNGTTFDQIEPYVQQTGLALDSEWPFLNSVVNQCRRPLPSHRLYGSAIKKFHLKSDDYTATIVKMQTDIYLNGPICSTIKIYRDFIEKYIASTTVEGLCFPVIYTPEVNQQLLGYHAINIVGWLKPNSSNFENACWVCITSWGNGFPKNQHPLYPNNFFIQMGTNCCSIEEYSVSAVPSNEPTQLSKFNRINGFNIG